MIWKLSLENSILLTCLTPLFFCSDSRDFLSSFSSTERQFYFFYQTNVYVLLTTRLTVYRRKAFRTFDLISVIWTRWNINVATFNDSWSQTAGYFENALKTHELERCDSYNCIQDKNLKLLPKLTMCVCLGGFWETSCTPLEVYTSFMKHSY